MYKRQYLDKAIKAPYFVSPEIVIKREGRTAVRGYPRDWGKRVNYLSNLLFLKAGYLFLQGREKEAWDEALKMLIIGKKICQDLRGSSISLALSIIGIRGTAQELITKLLLPQASLSRVELREYAERIRETKIPLKALKYFLKEKYVTVTEGLTGIEERKDSAPLINRLGKVKFLFKPNKTKLYFVQTFRKIINSPPSTLKELQRFQPPYHFDISVENKKAHSIFGLLKLFFTENSIGKAIYMDLITNDRFVLFEEVFILKALDDFDIDALSLMVAIKAYKNDFGMLPDSLSELVPEYISEIPLSPYDNKPLRYLKSKKLIRAGFAIRGEPVETKIDI